MRTKFLTQIIFLTMLMLGVSVAINANYYSQIITWGLFAYIIGKEIFDEYRAQRRRRRRYRWPISFFIHHLKIKGDNMEFQLHEDEVLPFRLGKPVNSEGGEAPIEEGSLNETVSDTTIFTVEQDDEQPDDPEAKMFVPHAVGTADYTAKADADLGEGVQEISLTVKGTVIAAGAVGFAPLLFGQPRKKKQPAESQPG
jgi:hypothetical protein